MKKTLLLLVIIAAVILSAACGQAAPKDGDDDFINPSTIGIRSAAGLNEQIHISLSKPAEGQYSVFYRPSGEEDFAPLDRELLLDGGDTVECYILGLAEGSYDVRIETGEGDGFSRVTLSGIDVERQDRSGYAHFGREEGIGGYNNDGTVKENAKIIYLTNENKNTLTLDIDGTTYTGIVDILQANSKMKEPLIIRVLGMITTNQWIPEKESSRPEDYGDLTDGYIESLFSDSLGENISGIPVNLYSADVGKCFRFVTTRDGIELTETVDYENVDAMECNVFETENACDITIEGVGTDAGFFQFGIGFMYSDSIEIKNLTFDSYPVDGLRFQAYCKFADIGLHGWYWIHNNTFLPGLNLWGGSDADGDESIDFACMHNATLSYNKFVQTGKTILLGGWEYDACMNMTFHHNYYCEASQRLPLSRNSNIHNYNNFFDNCWRGLSPRTSTYVFGEANYFLNVEVPYYCSGDETWGYVKSFGEIYEHCGEIEATTFVTDRGENVEGVCVPDEKTDCSGFDTDPELFYYDAANGCSDVELMNDAADVPDFVRTYAGAGVLVRLELD